MSAPVSQKHGYKAPSPRRLYPRLWNIAMSHITKSLHEEFSCFCAEKNRFIMSHVFLRQIPALDLLDDCCAEQCLWGLEEVQKTIYDQMDSENHVVAPTLK